MNITQMQSETSRFGADAAFVANVIATRHRNRARKLKGLLALLKAGFTVAIAQFDADVLLVNGQRKDWMFLETSIAHFPHNHPELFRKMRCNQCEALMINGLFCHETGCPNRNSRYDKKSDTWIKQRECFECGCTVDADQPCCE